MAAGIHAGFSVYPQGEHQVSGGPEETPAVVEPGVCEEIEALCQTCLDTCEPNGALFRRELIFGSREEAGTTGVRGYRQTIIREVFTNLEVGSTVPALDLGKFSA